jgi:hypothetical protein
MKSRDWLLREIKNTEEKLQVLKELLKNETGLGIEKLKEKRDFILEKIESTQERLRDYDDPNSEAYKKCPIPIDEQKRRTGDKIERYINQIKQYNALLSY